MYKVWNLLEFLFPIFLLDGIVITYPKTETGKCQNGEIQLGDEPPFKRPIIRMKPLPNASLRDWIGSYNVHNRPLIRGKKSVHSWSLPIQGAVRVFRGHDEWWFFVSNFDEEREEFVCCIVEIDFRIVLYIPSIAYWAWSTELPGQKLQFSRYIASLTPLNRVKGYRMMRRGSQVSKGHRVIIGSTKAAHKSTCGFPNRTELWCLSSIAHPNQ